MNKPIKVLIVEDSEDDAILALRALHRGGFDPTHQRVQTAADLQAALAQERWDAVISDFGMPGFTGLEALEIFRSTGLDIPFILISGTIGEATAVAAMKAGASDYMMKSSLARLAPALERELKEAQIRAANQQAQAALIDSEERFRQIAENIRDVFFLADVEDERVLYVSPAYEEIWGRSSESLYANPQSWTEAVHPDDRASAYEKYGQVVSTSKTEFEFRMVRPDDSIRWIKVRGFPVRDDADKIVRIAGIATDVTDHKTAAEKFKTAQDRITHLNRVYAVLSGINTLIVRVRDRDELFKEACRIAVEEGGFRMAMIATVHHNTTKIVPVATAGKDDELMTAINNILSSSEHAPKTMSARAIRDKKAVVSNAAQNDPQVLFSAQYIKAGVHSMAVFPLIVSDEAVGVLALYASETEFFKEEELKLLSELAGDVAFAIDHIEKQERLNYLVYYDVLTGLANRSLFLERVAQAMRSAVRSGDKLALFLIDLERFKNINDSLGRPAGDTLLRLVAEWLTSKVGDANLLARVSADQFAVVLPEVKQDGEVARALDQLMAAFLEHPFRLNDTVFRIAAKAGIALFPDDGADADTLFKNAEAALKKAKVSGERYLFYTQKMTEMVAGRLTLENQLRQALDKGEFVLHYQPKVSLASGKMTSAEALIRWNDPRTGLVPPGQFIPILEETGLIHEVGRWALRQAIEDALRWRSAGLAAVRVAVNVSPLQLRHRGFIDEVRQAISIDAHAAAGLELEITESLLMENVQHSITSLQAIRDMGVTLAIDDFGTGFSSLSYLSKFPVDTLKIDRSFVIEMTDAPESLALVSTIISLAHALKLKVVAEGVETEEQSRLLRVLNCDEIQGFLFSKPVPSDIFEAKYLALPSSP
ncbi:EAL domain-containing protein [Rhodoferax ferrireducens]|uniref:EAL domain-containing protein n=1 Tax=Rhodoferax ferrireducens TaxID=192843 RepID=UPI00298D7477|nr:EAL domain-containing protein [Rhodoferax ferrireducens]WPC68682.1 EAL domain-containing protein [Rhodoferax ferrireducens]